MSSQLGQPRPRTLPALAPLTVGRPEPLDFVRAAAAGGFDEIGIALGRSGELFPVVGNPTLMRELKATIDGLGLGLTAFEGSVSLTPEWRVEDTAAVLETGAALGASLVMLSSRDSDWSRNVDNLSRFAELAASFKLRAGFEFLPSLAVRSVAETKALIEATGRADVGMVVDALHLSRSGGTPAEVAALDASLITWVQLCDARAEVPPYEALWTEAIEDRLYPGEGALWLFELLDALPADMHIQLEAPCAANAHLSPAEQARLAAAATRTFLERYNTARDG
jgi:sugar phosphate isomerase/epimerase